MGNHVVEKQAIFSTFEGFLCLITRLESVHLHEQWEVPGVPMDQEGEHEASPSRITTLWDLLRAQTKLAKLGKVILYWL